MASTLGSVVDFLRQFGFYDVILPFLLVFVIVFAIFEKTRVLGTEGDRPKSNLNAVVAFVFAMVFIAATRLVEALNLALPYVVILLVMFVSVLLLVGAFFKEGEFDFFASFSNPKLRTSILTVVIAGVLVAFAAGLGWLEPIMVWITRNWNSTVVGAIAFGIFMLIMIAFIVGSSNNSPPSKSTGEKKP